MCRQMSRAMTEAEKLKAAADAYKLDLLQQKLAEREWDLQQAKERAATLDQENQGKASPADTWANCVSVLHTGRISDPEGCIYLVLPQAILSSAKAMSVAERFWCMHCSAVTRRYGAPCTS